MTCNFKVGQQVVSIVRQHDWTRIHDGRPMKGPYRGQVCRIIYMGPTIFTYTDGAAVIALRLEGWDSERLFSDRSFKPIKKNKKKYSIEVFKKLLTPFRKTVKITEDA